MLDQVFPGMAHHVGHAEEHDADRLSAREIVELALVVAHDDRAAVDQRDRGGRRERDRPLVHDRDLGCHALPHLLKGKYSTAPRGLGNPRAIMVDAQPSRFTVRPSQHRGQELMYKPFDLSGKVALVTGGNRGSGLGMADALAQSGADVMVWGTNEEKNKEAVAKLKAHGKRAAARKVNVGNEAEVVDAMGATLKEFGRVDTVIANAGIGGGAPSFSQMSTETWRRVHAVNEEGVFWTLREACKHMVERAGKGAAGGSLVGLASLAGLAGAGRNAAYSATKGAVQSMLRSI